MHPTTQSSIVRAEAEFERQLPERLRRAARYWTAGGVVELGARWLEAEGARSVLDVGSGIGKFCTLGALSSRLEFCGVEHRAELVAVARSAAQRVAAQRVSFVHAHFTEVEAGRSLLLTYYQFGGRIPLGYSLLRSARMTGRGRSMLRLWRKDRADLDHGYWLEDGNRVLRRGASLRPRKVR